MSHMNKLCHAGILEQYKQVLHINKRKQLLANKASSRLQQLCIRSRQRFWAYWCEVRVRDWFSCVIWRMNICGMSHSCVWHDPFIVWYLGGAVMRGGARSGFVNLKRVWYGVCIRVRWLIHICDMTHSYFGISAALLGVLVRGQSSWRIYMCGVTHSCATWLIYMCDMTHSLYDISTALLGALVRG